MVIRIPNRLALLLSLALAPACATTPADPPDPQPAAAEPAKPALTYDPADVTPPSGQGDRGYAPLEGDALEQARLSLDAILKQIEEPAFLDTSDEEDLGEAPPPPLSAARAYARGRAAFKAGDVGEAVNQLRLAQRLAPRVPDSYRLLGRIRSATRNLAMAEHEYEQAARLDPSDLETLVMLGRFAQEQQQTPRAIALFAAADQALARSTEGPARQDRPATAAVIDYHLATALANAGYADAARQRFQRFLDQPRDNVSPTIWARQLSVIDRQYDTIYRTVGDLNMQLGHPAAALEAYEAAAEEASTLSRPLVQRLVYTHLRLGEPDAARREVIDHVAATSGSPGSLDLVRYLIEQGVDAQTLGQELRRLYEQEDQRTALALALADLLPRDQAIDLLRTHLQRQPDARPAFEQLIQTMLGDSTADAPPAQIGSVLLTTADAMDAAPDQARAYGGFALSRIGPLDRIGPALDALSPDQRARSMIRVLQAMALAAQQQLEPAADLLQRTLAQHPDNQLARVELIRLLMAQNQLEKAAQLLGPLEDSTEPQLVQLRARVLSQTGQTDQALALLNRLMEDGVASGDLYLEKARLQLQQTDKAPQNVSDAEQTMLDGLNVHPQDEQLFAALFEIYDASGETGKYQALMRRLLGAIPQSRLGRLKRAEWLGLGGHADEAIELLTGLLQENPDDMPALDVLLDIYRRTRQVDEGRKLLDQLLADDPNDVPLLTRAAQFHGQTGDVARWIATVERIVELRPADEQRVQQLAQLYLQAGRPEKAVELLREKIDQGHMQPSMVLIYQLWQGLTQTGQMEAALSLVSDQLDRPEPANVTQLAELKWRTLVEMDRLDDAEQALRDAMERFPDEAADLGYQLAAVITRRGDRPRAERLMERLLQDHPDHAGMNNDLAYTWAQQNKNLDKALAMAQRAVATSDDTPAYLDTLGWALYKNGRFEEAVTRLQHAQTLADRQARELQVMTRQSRQLRQNARPGQPELDEPDDPMAPTRAVVGDHLGDALYQLGREDQAVRAWNQAMEHRMQVNPDEAAGDRDLVDMVQRLGEKLAAVRLSQPAPVADVPGVAAPAVEREGDDGGPDVPDALLEEPAGARAE